jgi:hypothetical protein
MNKTRLRELAKLLLKVPAREFDMEHWKCGTVACALGHAAQHPPFAAEGLTLEKNNWANDTWSPAFEDHHGFEAGALFFDITPRQSEYLFCPDDYQGKARRRHVITRIEELIAS